MRCGNHAITDASTDSGAVQGEDEGAVVDGAFAGGGAAIEAHCLVKGEMHRRVSPQDGKSYAIGFEMRLPRNC